jgi:integrase
MANLYKRNGSPFFWVKFRDKTGKIRQVSTECRTDRAPDVRRARAIAAQHTVDELETPRSAAEGWDWIRPFLSTRFVNKGLTRERYETAWRSISLFLTQNKIPRPASLTRKHCFDYLDWRKKPDKPNGKYRAGHNTALLELKLLRLVMGEAVVRGLCATNPCLKLGIQKQVTRRKPELTEEAIALIRANFHTPPDPAVQTMLRNSFEIALHQGCRLTETRLNPQTDVTLGPKSNTISFRTKGGREFTTLLHPDLVPFFQQLRQSGAVATWTPPAGAGRQWAGGHWHRYLDRIGLRELLGGGCFHSTRVTVITRMARSNVPISKAMKFVAHASSTIHATYQRLTPEDLQDCVEAVHYAPASDKPLSS